MKFVKYKSELKSLAKNFSCGNIVIDNFLKHGDALDENQGITYVLLSDDENFIIGYYNISVGRVDQIEEVGGHIRYIPMGGAVNINYLAVDERVQHTKITPEKKLYFCDYILRDCEKKILELRKGVGVAFVTLYSTGEGYRLYHDRNCYENFEDDMSTFVEETNKSCYKLYKWVDDIVE